MTGAPSSLSATCCSTAISMDPPPVEPGRAGSRGRRSDGDQVRAGGAGLAALLARRTAATSSSSQRSRTTRPARRRGHCSPSAGYVSSPFPDRGNAGEGPHPRRRSLIGSRRSRWRRGSPRCCPTRLRTRWVGSGRLGLRLWVWHGGPCRRCVTPAGPPHVRRWCGIRIHGGRHRCPEYASPHPTTRRPRHFCGSAGDTGEADLASVTVRAARLVGDWQASAVADHAGTSRCPAVDRRWHAAGRPRAGSDLRRPVRCRRPFRHQRGRAPGRRRPAIGGRARRGAVAAAAFVAAGGASAALPPRAKRAGIPCRGCICEDRTRRDVPAIVEDVRRRGGVVVATGGCFDLLHAGHVASLESAPSLGDCLVVCLNSDASIRRLKGIVATSDVAGGPAAGAVGAVVRRRCHRVRRGHAGAASRRTSS